ncbi:MAG TPA: MBL fold metallo-hydrolase RNA specificity domain-containing protein, partial [Mycobacteriales bacterium]|nr:MBL fold metallo-hydrolase RNA specificity domain-containing protein [Mycobacteriales bacterium]
WGATVIHKGVAMVHVSGHASAGELLYVLNATRPSNVLPVHGEIRHLRAHGELAVLTGVPRDRVVIAEDGLVVDLVDGLASVTGKVDCGYVYVDGLGVGAVEEETLRDRRILGDEGFVTVVVVVDSVTGKITAGPELFARGFAEDDSMLEEVRPRIEEALRRAASEGITDSHQLGQIIRRTVGQWVSGTHRRRPMIVPVVVEV